MEERTTEIGRYNIGNATTLESNKSLANMWRFLFNLAVPTQFECTDFNWQKGEKSCTKNTVGSVILSPQEKIS